MKKIAAIILSLLVCLCSVGCMSEEDKRIKEERNWYKHLTYDKFDMFGVYQNETFVDFDFFIRAENDMMYDSIIIGYLSDEAKQVKPLGLEEGTTIRKDEFFGIYVRFDERFISKSITPQNIPITVNYTTTSNQTVSKDYVLDFTQTPFRDLRNK